MLANGKQAKLLFNAAGAHKAPLVMIAAKPYLRNVVKLTIFPDFFLIDVAVIIQNRHGCSIAEI